MTQEKPSEFQAIKGQHIFSEHHRTLFKSSREYITFALKPCIYICIWE